VPRLIDELRAPGARRHMPHWVTPRREREWTDYALKLMEAASDPRMPVLLTSNVAEYFYSGTNQEHWSLDKDFPNIAPPFSYFWVEFKMAKIIRSEAGDTDVSRWLPQGGRVGQFWRALDRDEVNGEGIPDNVRWIYWCDMFIDYHRPEATADGPMGATFLMVDAEGRGVGNPWMLSYSAEGDEEASLVLKSIMAWYNPTLLAISFLHCKNVEMVDNVIDPKLAKRYRERHGVTPTPYKTLIIEPLKKVLHREGGSDKHGLAKAMHICRGHFKDYREGRGLFGKYHQLVWHPSLVRGTKGKRAPAREMEVRV
jgi:hypothetical protein